MSAASTSVANVSVVLLILAAICMFGGYGVLIAWAVRSTDRKGSFRLIMRCRDYRLLHPLAGKLIYAGAAFGFFAFVSFGIAAFAL